VIAVDTSALLAVVFKEPEAEVFDQMIIFGDCMIGAPVVLEARMALTRMQRADYEATLQFLITRANVDIVPFDGDQCQVATEAFKRYGRGSGHPAKLNFGDCMSYAVARRHGLPLLFKGNDFTYTDLEPVHRP
jgi:ribonuclease VapC